MTIKAFQMHSKDEVGEKLHKGVFNLLSQATNLMICNALTSSYDEVKFHEQFKYDEKDMQSIGMYEILEKPKKIRTLCEGRPGEWQDVLLLSVGASSVNQRWQTRLNRPISRVLWLFHMDPGSWWCSLSISGCCRSRTCNTHGRESCQR